MAWHGPRGDCGCCDIEPPPPPCPYCDENDCTPEGMRDFSSMKAVVLWDDEFTKTETRDGIATFDSCVCAEVNEQWVRAYAGMSAVNGTYDAAYVNIVDGVWVEADPATDCGFWFFPWLEVDLSYTDTFTRTFYNGCSPNVFQSQSRTISVYFDTYSGGFSRKVDAFPDISLTYLLGGNIPGRTFTYHWEPYACRPDDDPYTLNGEIGVTANTETKSFFSTVQSNAYADAPIFPTFTVGRVGTGGSLLIITYDGQLGSVRPYMNLSRVSWGDACAIRYESVENDLDAYYRFDNPFTQPCGLYSIAAERTLEWNAFNRKHTILLNA